MWPVATVFDVGCWFGGGGEVEWKGAGGGVFIQFKVHQTQRWLSANERLPCSSFRQCLIFKLPIQNIE